MKVAVVGVTGLVGTRMMEVLAERNFPVTEFLPVASERSVGRKVTFKGKYSGTKTLYFTLKMRLRRNRTWRFSRQAAARPENLLRNLRLWDAVSWIIRHAGVWILTRNSWCLK